MHNIPKFRTPLFHQGHHNVIAAEIREQIGHYYDPKVAPKEYLPLGEVLALTLLAVGFAKRFQLDNQHFNALKFLDQCSPYPEKLPLSELWKEGDELE